MGLVNRLLSPLRMKDDREEEEGFFEEDYDDEDSYDFSDEDEDDEDEYEESTRRSGGIFGFFRRKNRKYDEDYDELDDDDDDDDDDDEFYDGPPTHRRSREWTSSVRTQRAGSNEPRSAREVRQEHERREGSRSSSEWAAKGTSYDRLTRTDSTHSTLDRKDSTLRRRSLENTSYSRRSGIDSIYAGRTGDDDHYTARTRKDSSYAGRTGNNRSSSSQTSRETRRQKARITPLKYDSSGTYDGMRVKSILPKTFEECRTIVDAFLRDYTVLMNLEKLDFDYKQRTIDICCGVCYARNGNLQQIADNTYVLTPADVDLTGEFKRSLQELIPLQHSNY